MKGQGSLCVSQTICQQWEQVPYLQSIALSIHWQVAFPLLGLTALHEWNEDEQGVKFALSA